MEKIQNIIKKFKMIEELNPLINADIFSESSFLTMPSDDKVLEVYAVCKNCNYILDQGLLNVSNSQYLSSKKLTDDAKISVAANLRGVAFNAICEILGNKNDIHVKEFNLSSSSDDNTEIGILSGWFVVLQSTWSQIDYSSDELFCLRMFITSR
jgi:hypothetical protein